MPEFVSVEVRDSIATIRLDNRPFNHLTVQIRSELLAAVRGVAADDAVRAVLLYGGDKVFSAGDDVREFLDLDAEQAHRIAQSVDELFTAIATLPKPVVAAVSGYAISSGLGLALCADWRIIGDNVKVALGEVHQGGLPIGRTVTRLSNLIGDSRTRELAFSGRFVEHEEAKSVGLVDEVVAPDDVYDSAITWAKRMADASAATVGAVKRVLAFGSSDTQEFADLASSDARTSRLRAFLDRGLAADLR